MNTDKELIRIVDNASPDGFRVICRDEIQLGDVKYFEPQLDVRKEDDETDMKNPSGITPAEPIKNKKRKYL